MVVFNRKLTPAECMELATGQTPREARREARRAKFKKAWPSISRILCFAFNIFRRVRK